MTKARPPLQPQPSLHCKGRLLVVEDEPLMGEWLKIGLSEEGVEVTRVDSLSEALTFLGSGGAERIHGIVSDIYLKENEPQGMKILSEAQKLGIPVVIISSKANFELAKEALNNGACALLEKPFPLKSLMKVFERVWQEPSFLGVSLQRYVEKCQLTDKESEVCKLLFKGLSNAEIARVLNISEKTVKFHVSGIFSKCDVKSRSELLSSVFPV